MQLHKLVEICLQLRETLPNKSHDSKWSSTQSINWMPRNTTHFKLFQVYFLDNEEQQQKSEISSEISQSYNFTHRRFLIYRLDNKLLVTKWNIAHFTPGKSNFGSEPDASTNNKNNWDQNINPKCHNERTSLKCAGHLITQKQSNCLSI